MGSARALALSLALLLLVAVVCFAQDVQSDVAALLAVKAALADPQGVLTNWVAGVGNAPCDWSGVICEAGRVNELRLQDAGLQGPLAGKEIPFSLFRRSPGGLSFRRVLIVCGFCAQRDW